MRHTPACRNRNRTIHLAAQAWHALEVKLCAPRGTDPQTPHKQDEIYVVISGTGEFVCEGKRQNSHPIRVFDSTIIDRH
jgi:mannose-6-phosphate isomerase-like protein (cupin superfamily)